MGCELYFRAEKAVFLKQGTQTGNEGYCREQNLRFFRAETGRIGCSQPTAASGGPWHRRKEIHINNPENLPMSPSHSKMPLLRGLTQDGNKAAVILPTLEGVLCPPPPVHDMIPATWILDSQRPRHDRLFKQNP
jgi:hypothetical protein